MKKTVEKILFQFSTRTNKQRPFIVGIDGLGGAGKTTISKKIEQELINRNYQVVTFHLDDHIVERNKRYDTGYEEWYEYYYLQWDIKHLTTYFFGCLHHNKSPMSLDYYDKNTDSFTKKEIEITSDCIVLIEGVFLQRKEWRKFYDLIIFLSCSDDVRQKRVLNRDSYIGDHEARLKKYQTRYWLGEKHYLDKQQPTKNANIIYQV